MFKDQRSCSPGRKVQDKTRRKKRNRRRKKSISNIKGDADVKIEHTEENKMEVVETSSSQTQVNVPVETQHVELQAEDNMQTVEKSGEQCRKDGKMVHAQTQTRKCKGAHKFTQTPVVIPCNQETQTDFRVAKQDDASQEKTQAGEKNAAESQLTEDKQKAQPRLQCDNSAQTQLRQNEDNDEAPSDSAKEQNPQKEENLLAGKSGDPTDSQTDKGAKPKSYAKAVSGEGKGERQSNMDASKASDNTMKLSQNPR